MDEVDAMSALEELLEDGRPEPRGGGRAKRSLASLRVARGYRLLEEGTKVPARVSIRPLDETSTWRHIGGGMYEKEEP
jgi:hypothetical protein